MYTFREILRFDLKPWCAHFDAELLRTGATRDHTAVVV